MKEYAKPFWFTELCQETWSKYVEARNNRVTEIVKTAIRKSLSKQEYEEMDRNDMCCVLMDGKWQKKSKMVLKYPETFHVIALIRLKK